MEDIVVSHFLLDYGTMVSPVNKGNLTMARTEINRYGDEITYDDNGNCIYHKDSSGWEAWWEYGSNGKRIHARNSFGYEEYWDYNGNFITREEYEKLYSK